jgi:alkanesulfonate monooxygenase SsuD/methylene tetrahydromethanopterin reductase-like flavin-dependent oxidoreductase (luciferase family)
VDPQRTAFALRDPLPWDELVEVVATAERTGYEALFLPEITGRESFATLAGLAAVTSTLELGTGVVPMTSRRVETTAMAAATVHELSAGRMVLGIGTGSVAKGALERLRDAVLTLRAIFRGETVELGDPKRGSFRLSFEPGSRPIPIYISALGPKAIRMAGEVADGVLLNWCTPERAAEAVRLVAEGANAAGRDPTAVTVAAYIRACVGPDVGPALAALKAAAAQYASYPAYRRQFEAMGLGREAAEAAAAHRDGTNERVPASLVESVCLFGEGDEAARRLQAFRDAGVDLPVVYPVAAREPVSSILGSLVALAPSPASGP